MKVWLMQMGLVVDWKGEDREKWFGIHQELIFLTLPLTIASQHVEEVSL